jgi:hypothetical protein
MRTFVLLAVGLGIATLPIFSQAEPRWCSVSDTDPSNKLLYPPIARAARVSGTVLVHMIYEPNGKVQRIEPIFGPAMLSQAVSRQLMDWTVKTNAVGDALCETLVITDFKFSDLADSGTPAEKVSAPPGILRLSVEAEILVISDPGGEISYSGTFRSRVKRTLCWMFRQCK